MRRSGKKYDLCSGFVKVLRSLDILVNRLFLRQLQVTDFLGTGRGRGAFEDRVSPRAQGKFDQDIDIRANDVRKVGL